MKELKQNKKIVALITLITLIANMFFPYCSLISYAGVVIGSVKKLVM